MIYEFHRKVRNNIGDAYCNPSRYFNFNNLVSTDILNKTLVLTDENLIIGGGGLIHKGFQKDIKKLLEQLPNKVVLWGIGHNFGSKYVSKHKTGAYYPSWIYDADRIGIRDWIHDYEKYYLPCVSCMHSAFDNKYKVQHEVGFFIHSYKTSFESNSTDRVLENKHLDFDYAIKFLAESEIVVTDSYHGAYWAQLLGKPVIVKKWSVKFNHLKNPVINVDNLREWKNVKIGSSLSKDFLEESRDLNRKFYQKVLELFDS